MKKGLILLLMILFVVDISYSDENKVDSKIINILEDNSEVRVIVRLKDSSGGGIGKFSVVDKNEVINSLSEEEFKKTSEFSNINGFSGKINKKGLEKLISNPNVESIEHDYEVKKLLQDSVPLINASVTQSSLINSVNITGKDQTICILDTGINYTHSDLGGCSSSDFTNEQCSKVVSGYDYCGDGIGDCSDLTEDADPYDVDNHGTHVAGIAAASGNITGVAPDAKVIMIRVLNNSGSGLVSDIVKGIEWCTNNATKFNISVISMSLGGGAYSSYCDSSQTSYRDAINDAVAENITVVAATGNSNSAVNIASPACIENTTAVSATDKNDNIASYSNRNSLTDLLAPGGESTNELTKINSTSISGGYTGKQGTSMSAPHVAGAIALLQQYKKEELNISLTPSNVESALKNNGENITDTNGLNYTRIDVKNALISVDNKNPSLNLSSPINKLYTTNISLELNFSSIDTNLDLTWYNIDNGTNTTITGNLTFNLSEGTRVLYIFNNDSNKNENSTLVSFTVTAGIPITTLNSPTDGFNTSLTQVTFNCSAVDNANLSNITLYHNITGWKANETNQVNGTSNSTTFTTSNIPPNRNYIWNCLTMDNETNQDFADNNFTFRVDTLKPEISSVNAGSIGTSSATITWTTNELSNSTVYYGTTTAVSETPTRENNFVTSHSISLSSLSSSTTYYYNVSSCDLVNNCNTSVQYSFTTDASSGNGGGNGGGGGGSSSSSSSTTTTPITPSEEEEEVEEKEPEVKITSYSTAGGSTKEDFKALKELNPKLEEAINKVLGTTENIRLESKNVESLREIKVEDSKTSLTLQIHFRGNNTNDFLIYDEIPKSFADNINKVTIKAEDANITVIEEDPILMFFYPEIRKDEIKVISYEVNKVVDVGVIEETKKPIFLVKEEPKVIKEKFNWKKYWWLSLIIIALIILAIYLGEVIEYFKLKRK